jgi:predicted nucleic acid-binding protein
MFLELAISADAKTIVTRDADLLVLHPFKGISIITVSDFLRSY